MILDKNLILSDAQAVTSVGTHLSENVIDTVEVGDAVNELYFVACVETACEGTGPVTVDLITSDSETLDNPTVLWTSGSMTVGTLVDKYCIGIVRLPKANKLKRYIGAQIVLTGTLTDGKFDIYLTDNPQTNI